FIPVSTPGYDDPTKYHSGPAACQGSIVQIYYTISMCTCNFLI
ncbi:unnamed protein product, partial [Rotaria socialis]